VRVSGRFHGHLLPRFGELPSIVHLFSTSS